MDAARFCVCIFIVLLGLAALNESSSMDSQGTKEHVGSVIRRVWDTIRCAGGFLSGIIHAMGYLIFFVVALVFLITNPWALLLLFFLG